MVEPVEDVNASADAPSTLGASVTAGSPPTFRQPNGVPSERFCSKLPFVSCANISGSSPVGAGEAVSTGSGVSLGAGVGVDGAVGVGVVVALGVGIGVRG